MKKFAPKIDFTVITVLTVSLLATSGDMTMTWTSPMIPKLKSTDSSVNPLDEPITSSQDSLISSLINIGAVIGPIPFSFLAAKFGRKKALLAIAIPHIFSYVTLAFSRSVWLFYFARFLAGLSVGGGYTLLPMYIAEVAEDSRRGALSTVLNLFWTFGNLVPYIIGPYLPIIAFNVILACVPAIFFILFFFIAPETPYFLVRSENLEGAEESLKKLRSSASKQVIQEEIEHIQNVLEHDVDGKLADIFKSRTNLKALFISVCLVVLQQTSGINAILFYTQTIFLDAGMETVSPEVASIIVGLILFGSSFVTPFFADRGGRRLLLICSTIGMSISHGALGLFFYFKKCGADCDLGAVSWLPIPSLVVYIIFFNLGLGPLPWTISSEMFPASVKSAAAPIVSMACWGTSFLITQFYIQMNDAFGETAVGNAGTFWVYAGFCALALVFTVLVVPETKGKSFKEIQILLGNKDVAGDDIKQNKAV